MRSLRPTIRSNGPLFPLIPTTTCHLDPDLVKDVIPRKPGWRPLFGQVGAPQTHLENQGIQVGDVFLFFGWFRRTKEIDGKLKFEAGEWKQGKHVIFGYLQVGEILNVRMDTKVPAWMQYHPHFESFRRKKKNNTIYVARETLSWDESITGAGVFNYSDNLVLTKPGCSRSKWVLPDIFKELKISHHSSKSWKHDYFQSAAIGQEFVVEESKEVERWVEKLVGGNCTRRNSIM
jgi:hypothetical protein